MKIKTLELGIYNWVSPLKFLCDKEDWTSLNPL